MLKIKDSVDLKELEKFGFSFEYDCKFMSKFIAPDVEVFIDMQNKEIEAYGNEMDTELTGLVLELHIKDLIQANLVEEVEVWKKKKCLKKNNIR